MTDLPSSFDLSRRKIIFVYLDDVMITSKKNRTFQAKICIRRDVNPFSHTAGNYLWNGMHSEDSLKPINHWQDISEDDLDSILSAYGYTIDRFMVLPEKLKLAFDVNLMTKKDMLPASYDFSILNSKSIIDFDFYRDEFSWWIASVDTINKLSGVLAHHDDDAYASIVRADDFADTQYDLVLHMKYDEVYKEFNPDELAFDSDITNSDDDNDDSDSISFDSNLNDAESPDIEPLPFLPDK